MKHLLSAAAVAASLVIAAPVWAQNPSGGNAVGTPGPNPGGPGLTPYSGGGASAPTANSAMPPPHRHAHAMHHFHRHMARQAALRGDTTAQLNREELSRIQSGNLGNPPAPAAPPEGSMAPGANPSERSPGPKASSGSYIPSNQP